MSQTDSQHRACLRNQLWEADPYCHYCRDHVERADATLDHVVPRSLGGRDDLANLVLACGECNCAKADRSYEEFTACMAGDVAFRCWYR